MIERKVSVGFGSNSYTKIRVSQFDSAWTFVFAVYMDGDRWTIPSGITVTLNGRKPDKNVFSYSGTVSDNTVRVDGDVQMTAVAGMTICELVFLESNGKTVGTANFILAVEEAPKSPDDVESESTLPAYAAILNAVSEDDESVRKAKESENKAAASAAEAQRILDSIPSDYSALQAEVDLSDKYQKLLHDEIPGTTQTYEFEEGAVSRVVHKSGNSTVRTDTFTYTDAMITETRTLSTGEKMVIATNLETLETATTYTAA